MNKRLGVCTTFVVVALLMLGLHFYGGQRVPAGQLPLISLTPTNFDQLRTMFNATTGKVRIVLLLSPT
jgi:hypothetical protein